MRNYFFLANTLPDLSVDSKPVMAFSELMVLFNENLSSSDLEEVRVLRAFYDVMNLERLLDEEELDFRANLNYNELKDELVHQEYLPKYFFNFLEKHKENEEQRLFFPELLMDYFRTESEKKKVSAFVLQFERKLRLFLLAYRAFKSNLSLDEELRFEDKNDALVGLLLSSKSIHDLDFGDEYQHLAASLDQLKENPLEEEKLILKFRFDFYTNFAIGHPFSLYNLLAFMMKLILLEDFEKHEKEDGNLILNSILKDSA
ncbi:MAG: DUF2764 domain-containing protein [Simkaniaceae bacterium]|nr:DUF2764 domain-containing protein [Simkaniaceae bacterium]